jgi:hypothetical protein
MEDRTMEQEEAVVGKQWDCKHIFVVMNKHAKVEKLLIMVFSM